MFKRVQSYMEL